MRLTVIALVSFALIAPVAPAAEITLQTEHTGRINKSVYSPDGKLLATASTDSTIKLWSLPDGRLFKTFPGHAGEVKDVAFSPDGKLLASMEESGKVRIWSLPDCKQYRTLIPKSQMEARQLVFSPDGRFLLLSQYGLADALITMWLLPECRLSKKLTGERGKAVFSPDGARLAVWFSKRVRVFQLPGIKRIAEVRHADKVDAVAFSPDGKHLASGGWDGVVKLWSLPSGVLVKATEAESNWVGKVAFSPDGKYLAAGVGGLLKLLAMPDGRLAHNIKSGYGGQLSFSAKSDLLVTGNTWWSIPGGKKAGSTSETFITAVSPDLRTLLSSKDKKLRLLSFPSGRALATLHGSPERFPVKKIVRTEFSTRGQQLEMVLVSPDKSKIRVVALPGGTPSPLERGSDVSASPGKDGILRFKNRADNKLLMTMVLFEDGEWIAYTPDGLYEATIDAASRIAWRFGTDVAGFEQYEADFHRPGLIKVILMGKSPGSAPVPTRPPLLDLRDNRELIQASKAFTKIQMKVWDQDQVDKVRVFVNGRLSAEKSVNAKQKNLSVKVPLSLGTNRVTAIAYNRKGYSSFPHFLDARFEKPRAPKPDLFLLSVGISKYPNMGAEFQLDYADDDARALARAFGAQKGKMFKKVKTVTLTGKKATVKNIKTALKQMSSLKPGSLAIIFLAGHGVKDDRSGKYYYLTRNSRFKGPASAGLDWKVFQDLLSRVKCRVVLLLDTCHSGAISEETIVRNDELVNNMLADERSGVLIFTAAKGRQESVESPDLGTGEGLFTWTILEALDAVPWNHLGEKTRNLVVDENGDKTIQISELMRFVTGRAHDVSGGFQTPRISRQEICGDFPVAFLEEYEPRRLTGHSGEVEALAVSPNSKLIASGGLDHTVRLWSLPARKQHRVLKGHSDRVTQLEFTPNGKLLISGGKDKTIRIWSLPAGKPRKEISGHASWISALEVSPNGKLLASASAKRYGSEGGNSIRIWSLPAGKPVRTLQKDGKSVYQLAFSPNGKLLAARIHGLAVKVWSVGKWKQMADLEGHSNDVTAMAFTPDGRYLLTGGKDRRINLWSLPDGKLLKTVRDHKQGISSLAVSPDESYFASGGQDGTVMLWSLPDCKLTNTATEKGHSDALHFARDGTLLAGTKLYTDEIQLRSVPELSRLVTFFKHMGDPGSLAFSPDNKWLAVPGIGGTVNVWSLSREGVRRILGKK